MSSQTPAAAAALLLALAAAAPSIAAAAKGSAQAQDSVQDQQAEALRLGESYYKDRGADTAAPVLQAMYGMALPPSLARSNLDRAKELATLARDALATVTSSDAAWAEAQQAGLSQAKVTEVKEALALLDTAIERAKG